jgi:hypothetical protein
MINPNGSDARLSIKSNLFGILFVSKTGVLLACWASKENEVTSNIHVFWCLALPNSTQI